MHSSELEWANDDGDGDHCAITKESQCRNMGCSVFSVLTVHIGFSNHSSSPPWHQPSLHSFLSVTTMSFKHILCLVSMKYLGVWHTDMSDMSQECFDSVNTTTNRPWSPNKSPPSCILGHDYHLNIDISCPNQDTTSLSACLGNTLAIYICTNVDNQQFIMLTISQTRIQVKSSLEPKLNWRGDFTLLTFPPVRAALSSQAGQFVPTPKGLEQLTK